jgi:hypothetical protein
MLLSCPQCLLGSCLPIKRSHTRPWSDFLHATCVVHTDHLRRRFLPKRPSLAAVLADDERLAGLTEAQILAEVRAQVSGPNCAHGEQ